MLLVKVPTMKDKGQIMKSARNLTRAKNISIRPDLTPIQQKARRELIAKLIEKRTASDDPTKWRIDYRRWEVVHYQN